MKTVKRYGLMLIAVMLLVMMINVPPTDATNSSLIEEKGRSKPILEKRLKQEKRI